MAGLPAVFAQGPCSCFTPVSRTIREWLAAFALFPPVEAGSIMTLMPKQARLPATRDMAERLESKHTMRSSNQARFLETVHLALFMLMPHILHLELAEYMLTEYSLIVRFPVIKATLREG